MFGFAASLTEPAASPRDVPELLQKGPHRQRVQVDCKSVAGKKDFNKQDSIVRRSPGSNFPATDQPR
jgi:hypothetical protein